MYEDMPNTPLADFEKFTTKIGEKDYSMLYDAASDLAIILNYAPGRHLIYKGKKVEELLKLDQAEMSTHPEAKMCLADTGELEESTPTELFKSMF